MKRAFFMLIIIWGSLFCETAFEPVDSTNAEQIQSLKNELQADMKSQGQIIEENILLFQDTIREIQKTFLEQQNKLSEFEKTTSLQSQDITKISAKQNSDFIILENKLTAYSDDFGTFRNTLETRLDSLSVELQTTSQKLDTYSSVTQNKIGSIDSRLENRTWYGAIGSFILLFFIIVSYIVLKYLIKNRTRALDENIIDTRNKIETESIKLDAKLIELLEKQLKLIELTPSVKEEEKDHSMFIKVANEIQRMRTRIRHMPEDTRGIGALKNALRRLEEELNENEYELVDLTGREYDEGLNTKARFIGSEEIAKGKLKITKTIKLQINYKGKVIQPSEIEVSIGE